MRKSCAPKVRILTHRSTRAKKAVRAPRSAKALTGDLRLLEIKKCRGDREKQDVNAHVYQVWRLESMGHTGKYVAADERFSALRRGPLAQGIRQTRQSSHTEYRRFQKYYRPQEEISCRHILGQ